MDAIAETTQEPEITPWEKTDEALDAAAELMPECPSDATDDEGEPAADAEAADGGDA